MPTARTDPARGLLTDAIENGILRLGRYLASPDLAPFVEHFWSVEWDLRGKPPLLQETLPYPSVHLVFEQDQPLIYGVMRRKFARVLEGQARVFAVKFRPGAFYGLLQRPVSTITERVLSAVDVFSQPVLDLHHTVSHHQTVSQLYDDDAAIHITETFLRGYLREPDPTAVALHQVVNFLLTAPEVVRVDELCARLQLGPRTLQRLFSRYIGVSPKWVIKRGRLHEATQRIAAAADPDWASLAHELGYFDQAHFIHDFKTAVGRTPGEYAHARVSQSLPSQSLPATQS